MSSTELSPILSSLNRALDSHKSQISMVGCTQPTFLAWLLGQDHKPQKSRLIICPNHKIALALAHDLSALFPNQKPILLEPFDESPYSGLYPSNTCIQSRTHFLWRAQKAKANEVFISGIEALLQKTVPIEIFSKYEVVLKKGEEIDLDTLCRQLGECGYEATPLVEDGGTFSRRGDILDIFSPAHAHPIRLELFGDQIESIRFFDIQSQRSEEEAPTAVVTPAREIILSKDSIERAKKNIKILCDEHGVKKDIRESLTLPLDQGIFPHGIDYWVSSFYENAQSPLEVFKPTPQVFWLDAMEITRSADGLFEQYRDKFREQIKSQNAAPDPTDLYVSLESFTTLTQNISIKINQVHLEDQTSAETEVISCKVFDVSELSTVVRAARESKKDFIQPAVDKILSWKNDGYHCFLWTGTQTQAQRIKYLFESHGAAAEIIEDQEIQWSTWRKMQSAQQNLIHIISRPLTSSARFVDEKLIFLREEDIFGSRVHREQKKSKGTLDQRTRSLSFGDLNPGDLIAHTLHGVGVYEGLKKIAVQGVENEFIQLKYKDNDKLYLPVYRIAQIQKFSGVGGSAIIDRLGSTSWQKAKIKVRSSLKDLASDLLALYSRRASTPGYSFSQPDDDFREFEATFPFDETPDQAKAIEDVLDDMQKNSPMDRLVCGDVGFGKTEVAIRAAYKAVQDKKQVAVLVPTTILAFQHFQNFKKRFQDVAVSVGMISRFSTPAQVKKDLLNLQEGKLDILIGTHRLLSKDISFKDLGLLVVDEEQKFGVTHKEKIKRMRSQVDVLTLSATPIPRTLNMGLMGIRDLSIINTPPEDRMSIRTFISRFDDETIRKAITGEVKRGGQVFFIHNRVQSIYGFADQIRQIAPDVKMRVAHGQMPDDELERTMLDFYNHEFDVLICTTIIESGLDIPTANTIIIDRADTFGLSQLYQLRGRVGRSKERAYAYLLIPPQGVVDKTALERLKIIQEYTDLGSGFHIAHHDLELRGSGNILGDDQSGHIAAVGYELYMELLEQALSEAKGESQEEEIEPEINLRIPALFPDSYIEDIRIRLAYYKALSEITDEGDLDRIELELVDRFGQMPEQVTNLFGVMLIRKFCKDLGVRDISSGPKNLSLVFTNATKVKPEAVIKLAINDSKKYQITPDQKLIIRMNSVGWPPILEELKGLKKILF
ncbi:MAG: transcription-repair coupling factor [Oligoflexia bacterium]|nr:transcription-repair coupling factor [Oligoflexia bacterium]